MAVFITGASSGIGEACASAFAEAGHELILMARRKDRLTELAEDLRNRFDVKVHVLVGDVRDRAGLEGWAARHAELADSVEVLINNAGLALGFDTLQEGNPGDWDAMIDTNVKGLLYVSRIFLPRMVARASSGGLAHVVNLGSVAGYWVYPKGNVYNASKFAVRALTEAMRMDLHGTGVRVTEIAPGMVETEFSAVRLRDEARAKKVYEGLKPLSPADIAETVLWCVQRPAHVDIQELVIFPTAQASVQHVKRD
jgi:NADP-dependent 3-hydroxy acid dehydrogenase YdfG